MKILSFDVGIRNLAYCVINKTSEDTFTIDDWGLINLDDDRKTCTFLMRNKKICTKVAHFILSSGTKSEYLCKAHKKSHVIEEVNATKCESSLLCRFVKSENTECGKKSVGIIDKSSYCNTHIKTISKQILKEKTPKKLAKQNANKLGVQTLATKLFTKLDNIPNLLTVEEVLIENQPTLLNPTMKTIASFIYSYFCIRGLLDSNNPSIKSINFFSPSNKLKVNKEQSDKILKKGETKKDIYVITKDLGEAYCKAIIGKERLEFLTKYEKQDDLCDAFLQGFFYLFCKEAVPEKYKGTLEKIASDMEKKQLELQKKKDAKKKKQEEDTKGIDITTDA